MTVPFASVTTPPHAAPAQEPSKGIEQPAVSGDTTNRIVCVPPADEPVATNVAPPQHCSSTNDESHEQSSPGAATSIVSTSVPGRFVTSPVSITHSRALPPRQ